MKKVREIENSIEPSTSSEDIKNSESRSGYRSIFKATSVFGGVQVFNIIITLVRGKVLAVLIGTAGMGLNGLLMSGLTLIKTASGLGLTESAIRDISAANQSNDVRRIQVVYTIFKRWIWLSAIIGVVLTISLSPVLSKLAFGNRDHTVAFILLSVTFIFGALTGGIYTLLRGMRKIKVLASANISGSLAGLLVAIPIFYFYGIKGVVPAIIASAGATYLVSIYFRKKIEVKTIKLSLAETFSGGKKMVALGIVLTASTLFTSGIKFVLSAYISKAGGLDDLGLYNAGYSIMSGYVGMVFAAMATDYYPRLSGVIHNPREWKDVVNQQSETVLLILGPILAFILFSAPFLIRILLSSEFLPVIDYLTWATLSVLFRAISWASGFIIISKADNKIFLYSQMAAITWSLGFNILFYNLLGVKGLGISVIINQLLSVVLMFIVLKGRYQFVISRSTYLLAGLYSLLLTATAILISQLDYPRAYFFAGLTFIVILGISISGLNRRMDLMQFFKKYTK